MLWLIKPNELVEFNGEYFIVPVNINYLYPNLSSSDIYEPIGYTHSFRDCLETTGDFTNYPRIFEKPLFVI